MPQTAQPHKGCHGLCWVQQQQWLPWHSANQPTNPRREGRRVGGKEGRNKQTNKQIKLFPCSNNFFVFKLPTSRVRQLLWWVLTTKSQMSWCKPVNKYVSENWRTQNTVLCVGAVVTCVSLENMKGINFSWGFNQHSEFIWSLVQQSLLSHACSWVH